MELHRMFLPEEIFTVFPVGSPLEIIVSESCFFSLAESSLSAIFLSGACSEMLYFSPVSAPDNMLFCMVPGMITGAILLFKVSFTPSLS